MASRRRAREYALQALFQADLAAVEVSGALNALWTGILEDSDGSLGGRQAEEQEIDFASLIAEGVERERDQLDRKIETCSTNWRMSRMSPVDRNILRLAAYELIHMDEVPSHVTLNEAIELAKKFGTAQSKGFVNGILDRLAREAGQL
jgi:N utilization substance protein B